MLLADALEEVRSDDPVIERLYIPAEEGKGEKIEEMGDVVTWWRVPTLGQLGRHVLWRLKQGEDPDVAKMITARWRVTGCPHGPEFELDLAELFAELSKWKPNLKPKKPGGSNGSGEPDESAARAATRAAEDAPDDRIDA